MATRLSCCLFLTLLVVPTLNGKDKKKSSLLDLVLSARTVVVVIRPDAGEPLDQPGANATARENVEKALMEWGRLESMMDGQETDLVIAVRAGNGRTVSPTVKGGPIDSRPTVGQSTPTSLPIAAQQGHPPPIADPRPSAPHNNAPPLGHEVSPSQGSCELSLGKPQ